MPLQNDRITANLGFPELEVLGVAEGNNELIVRVKRRQDMECCPGCGQITDKIHSSWLTQVFDLPIFGKKMRLEVLKRRFRCGNGCKPFTEGFGCLERYKRQTKRYRVHLEGQEQPILKSSPWARLWALTSLAEDAGYGCMLGSRI